jgi:hypothetical protein
MGIGGWILLIVGGGVLWLALVFVLGVTAAGTGETKWQVFQRLFGEICRDISKP